MASQQAMRSAPEQAEVATACCVGDRRVACLGVKWRGGGGGGGRRVVGRWNRKVLEDRSALSRPTDAFF